MTSTEGRRSGVWMSARKQKSQFNEEVEKAEFVVSLHGKLLLVATEKKDVQPTLDPVRLDQET